MVSKDIRVQNRLRNNLMFAGSYLHLEANKGRKGDTVNLYSSVYHFERDVCISIWYHMYGKTIGELNVQLIDETKHVISKLWYRQGKHEIYCS